MNDTRERLPDTRPSITHKAVIRAAAPFGRVKFFFTVGFYPDGRPAELFLHMDESGSTLDGFADSWSIAISIALQRGESLESLVKKFGYQEFEPKGITEDQEIPFARSVVDYVMRWMEIWERKRNAKD
ncbi:MAG: hypothetical protein PHX05_00170 [Acidobacteriota bacterium]|nr:hypothetical protein [Acidobacteriota bacterium]